MHNSYKDIRDAISRDPQWYDEHAVPRYCQFHPTALANIYADEAALVLIACQSCGEKFHVGFSRSDSIDRVLAIMNGHEYRSLGESIRSGAVHFGDPPNTGCCAAGATMNCDDLKVLEYWRRENFDWVRHRALEIDLPDLVGAAEHG